LLRLKLVRGKYDEDWYPGPMSGTVWEGDYVIELADEIGNTIAKTELSRYYHEPLIFLSHFQLEFDEYNGDGDIDFTIGQYASSNGWDYRLFTLRENGEIEELPIRDHSSSCACITRILGRCGWRESFAGTGKLLFRRNIGKWSCSTGQADRPVGMNPP
jgi:hypothetical protein